MLGLIDTMRAEGHAVESIIRVLREAVSGPDECLNPDLVPGCRVAERVDDEIGLTAIGTVEGDDEIRSDSHAVSVSPDRLLRSAGTLRSRWSLQDRR